MPVGFWGIFHTMRASCHFFNRIKPGFRKILYKGTGWEIFLKTAWHLDVDPRERLPFLSYVATVGGGRLKATLF